MGSGIFLLNATLNSLKYMYCPTTVDSRNSIIYQYKPTERREYITRPPPLDPTQLYATPR